MKTAGRENPNHRVTWPRNRAHGAVGQNRSRSIKWAEKQEKFQPKEMCFFLTSTFIELIGTNRGWLLPSLRHSQVSRWKSEPQYYAGRPRATAARLSPDALGHQLMKGLTRRPLRFSIPSFLRTLETWNFAVRSQMFNWCAISLFVRCLKSSWST